MLTTLLQKLNNKTLSIIIVCLLFLVCAIPVPSFLSYSAIQKKMVETDRECESLEEKHAELTTREKILSRDLHEIDQLLHGHLGGINSALHLRNIILKLAKINQIQTSSCLFKDSRLMNQNSKGELGIGKDVYSVVIDIKGTSFLEDLLIFIYILEELRISLRMEEFSVVDLANKSHQYSFSTSFSGFYVVDTKEN